MFSFLQVSLADNVITLYMFTRDVPTTREETCSAMGLYLALMQMGFVSRSQSLALRHEVQYSVSPP